ncbi:MAG: N-acetylglucosamine-6-phosphate deacetylase [Planctomycetota bacterium]
MGKTLDESAFLREAIVGFHLEGPFISPEPGYRGAHPAAHVEGKAGEPSWDRFSRWQDESGNRIRLVTIAPERKGSLEFIRKASSSGVVVALGHTNASVEEIQASVDSGATLFTHLGNGVPMLAPRHDNIIQRVIGIPGLSVSLIPDGIHLPPFLLSNLSRALGSRRVLFTTDCVSPAGCPPGRFRLGDLEVEVGEDRVVWNPDRTSFAGSALTMDAGFYNCIRFGGMSADGAWRGWTWLRRRMFPALKPPMLAIPFPEIAIGS